MTVVRSQTRDVFQKNSMKAFGDSQIVLRTKRLAAQIIKGGACHTTNRPLDFDLAAQHRKRRRFFGLAALQVRPQQFKGGQTALGCGREPDLVARQTVETEILGPCGLHHHGLFAQNIDEGHEELAVDTVLVQVLWRAVRGNGQNHLLLEQGIEQTP